MSFWEAVSALPTNQVLFLVVALAVAFGFEFINGFHDTANAVTTVIYTRTMRPTPSVLYSGSMNFVGVLVGGTTVAFSIVNLLPVDLLVAANSGAALAMVLSLLLAGVIWNLGTWYLGIPVSSSHTLIGSILGVGLANSLLEGHGISRVNWGKAGEVGLALLISPLIGFAFAFLLLLAMKGVFREPRLYVPPVGDERPPQWVRWVLIGTCGGVSFAHGSNDGQKGMGLILLVLVGFLPTYYALDTNKPGEAREVRAALPQARAALADRGDSPQWAEDLDALERDLDGKDSFDELAGEKRWEVRQAIFRTSEALKAAEAAPSLRRAFTGAIEFVPLWVVVGVAVALGLGTTIGYKRIVVTVAEKIGKTHLTYAQGAAAEVVAMVTILGADLAHAPVSTTQVLSSGIAGTMAANRSGIQGGRAAGSCSPGRSPCRARSFWPVVCSRSDDGWPGEQWEATLNQRCAFPAGASPFRGGSRTFMTHLMKLLLLSAFLVAGMSTEALAKGPPTAPADKTLLAQILSIDGSADRAALITKLADKDLRSKMTALLPDIERAVKVRRSTLALEAEIKEVGGKLICTPSGPQWLYLAAGDTVVEIFDIPAAIDLYNGNNPLKGKGGRNERVTDAWLKRLSGVNTLRKLDLANCAIHGEGLQHIGALTGLRELNLTLTPVKDDALKHLGSLAELRILGLASTQCNGTGFQHLTALKKLESVNFHFTPLNDEGLRAIAQVPISGRLWFAHTRFTDEGAASLKSLTQLKRCGLGSTSKGSSGEAVAALTKLPLEDLALLDNQASPAGLAHATRIVTLRRLDVSHAPTVKDASMQLVAQMPALEEFKLGSAQVTDDGLQLLAASKSLKKLTLSGLKSITPKGIEKLRKAQPKWMIEVKY